MKATLVVLPNTILNQWRQEAEKWAPALKIVQFQGGKYWQEARAVREFEEADIVLTIYEQLTNASKSRGGALLQVAASTHTQTL